MFGENGWLDPIIFQWGFLAVRWYGLMYVLAYGFAIYMMRKEIAAKRLDLSLLQLDNLILYLLVGMFLGARTAYVTIYDWDRFVAHPEELLQFWLGGLSFHGALVGMMLAVLIFARRNKKPYWHILDHMALVAPMGFLFGRIGNFINGELYGRLADPSLPWAMIFPYSDGLPRHPSQLYQGLTEGLFLFLVIRFIYRRDRLLKAPRQHGFYAGLFLIGYGIARALIEQFREPDRQLGFYFGGLTMGQMLCFIMIIAGVLVLKVTQKPKLVSSRAYKKPSPK